MAEEILREEIYWAEFKACGFLKRASIAGVVGDINWHLPSHVVAGQLSSEYQLDYQFKDFPSIDEGDEILLLDDDDIPIPGEVYRVRTPPRVAEGLDMLWDSRSGFFRVAMATKVDT